MWHQHYAQKPHDQADGSDQRGLAESEPPLPGHPSLTWTARSHSPLSDFSWRPLSYRWQSCGLAGGRWSPDTTGELLLEQQHDAIDPFLKKSFLGVGRGVGERETQVSSRREWEPVYEKHPKLSALSRVTHARESARPSWRGRAPFPQSRMPASIEEFNKAKCMYV